jgi:hypothetical protein
VFEIVEWVSMDGEPAPEVKAVEESAAPARRRRNA